MTAIRPVRRLRVGTVAVATVVVLVVTLAVSVASKPARLVTAVPAPEATLATPPTRVSLTFSTTIDPARSHVAVGGTAGTPVGCGAAVVSGNTVALPVVLVDPGTYLVAFHVVTGDGHEVVGETRFVVTTGRAGVPRPEPCAAGEASDLRSAYGTGAHDHGDVDPLSLVVILLDTALIVVVVVLLFRPRVRVRRAAVTDRTAGDDPRTGSG
jgi:methionine-rich copper-binding protein CopC